jgi:aspartate oxidase
MAADGSKYALRGRKIMNVDVIVIGAGLAGIMGAKAACDRGAKVLLLTHRTVGLATNSAISNGVFAGPTATYAADAYVQDTFLIGKKLNSRPHIQAVAEGIGPAVSFLRSAGCPITETHGYYLVQPSRPDVIPGVTLMKTLAAHVKGLSGLTVRAGFYATEILSHEGRVWGVKGVDKEGAAMTFRAPAVILAGGGAGAIYLRNDNQKRALGQGYAMALRAGLELRDMEFVQFYPFVQAEPGLPSMLLYPPVPQNARLINARGEDLAARFGMGNLNDMILKKRDDLSALLHEALSAGPIYMDYRDIPAADWEHPPLAMLAKLKFDFRNKPFAIAPAVHFLMGGIRTDSETQTQMPGLFACGEVAWGLHGANRRGGNALAECVVFGQIAGTQAARWASAQPLSAATPSLTHAPANGAPCGPSAMAPLRQLGRQLREVAWADAGVVRSGQGLRAGLASLRKIEAGIRGIEPGTADESIKKMDLLAAALVLRAIFAASIGRQESLGSFKRTDFPEEVELSRHGNSCIRYDAATDRISVAFTGSTPTA